MVELSDSSDFVSELSSWNKNRKVNPEHQKRIIVQLIKAMKCDENGFWSFDFLNSKGMHLLFQVFKRYQAMYKPRNTSNGSSINTEILSKSIEAIIILANTNGGLKRFFQEQDLVDQFFLEIFSNKDIIQNKTMKKKAIEFLFFASSKKYGFFLSLLEKYKLTKQKSLLQFIVEEEKENTDLHKIKYLNLLLLECDKKKKKELINEIKHTEFEKILEKLKNKLLKDIQLQSLSACSMELSQKDKQDKSIKSKQNRTKDLNNSLSTIKEFLKILRFDEPTKNSNKKLVINKSIYLEPQIIKINHEENVPPKLKQSCNFIFNKKMFIWGGSNAMESSNALYCYDFGESKQWKKIQQTGEIPCPRTDSIFLVFDDFFYILGGKDKTTFFGDFHRLDLHNFRWEKLNLEIIGEICSSIPFIHKNDFYFFGGEKANSGRITLSKSTYKIDMQDHLNKRDFNVTKIQTLKNPRIRRIAGGKKLYQTPFSVFFFGGFEKNKYGNVQFNKERIFKLDLLSFEWKMIRVRSDRIGTIGHCCIPIGINKVLVIGGYNQKVKENISYLYTFTGRVTVKKMNFHVYSRYFSSLSVTKDGSMAFLFGGKSSISRNSETNALLQLNINLDEKEKEKERKFRKNRKELIEAKQKEIKLIEQLREKIIEEKMITKNKRETLQLKEGLRLENLKENVKPEKSNAQIHNQNEKLEKDNSGNCEDQKNEQIEDQKNKLEIEKLKRELEDSKKKNKKLKNELRMLRNVLEEKENPKSNIEEESEEQNKEEENEFEESLVKKMQELNIPDKEDFGYIKFLKEQGIYNLCDMFPVEGELYFWDDCQIICHFEDISKHFRNVDSRKIKNEFEKLKNVIENKQKSLTEQIKEVQEIIEAFSNILSKQNYEEEIKGYEKYKKFLENHIFRIVGTPDCSENKNQIKNEYVDFNPSVHMNSLFDIVCDKAFSNINDAHKLIVLKLLSKIIETVLLTRKNGNDIEKTSKEEFTERIKFLKIFDKTSATLKQNHSEEKYMIHHYYQLILKGLDSLQSNETIGIVKYGNSIFKLVGNIASKEYLSAACTVLEFGKNLFDDTISIVNNYNLIKNWYDAYLKLKLHYYIVIQLEEDIKDRRELNQIFEEFQKAVKKLYTIVPSGKNEKERIKSNFNPLKSSTYKVALAEIISDCTQNKRIGKNFRNSIEGDEIFKEFTHSNHSEDKPTQIFYNWAKKCIITNLKI